MTDVKTKERFRVRCAVYLFLWENDQVMLMRRHNTGWKDGFYNPITGHVDGNESISDAVIREAKEEAGITVKKEHLMPAHVMHRFSESEEYVDFFYIATVWEGSPRIMEKDKCDNLDWFPINDLPEKTLIYIPTVIENYQKGIPFSEFGWEK